MARKATTKEDVLTLARRRVAETFDRFDLPAVSFSAGKDSTVVLNLAMEEMAIRKADGRLPADWKLRVIFWDEECVHPETIDYARRVYQNPELDFWWLCVPIKHVNACSKKSPFWYCWAEEDRDKWVRELPPEAMTTLPGPGFARQSHFQCMPYVFPKSEGVTVGLMMGIRADESMRRYRSVTHRVVDNWLSSIDNAKHVTQCKVIYDWRTYDVWTAPQVFGWDWNRAYDVMAKAGLSPHQQRVAPPFPQQPLQNLWMWRVCWPDLWEKLCMRVPGAATAARYAKSPLYGGSGVAEKRDGESWEDAITRELMKWEGSIQKEIVKRVRREIRRHNKMFPGVPLPETEPYSMNLETGVTSGITWAWLLKVVIKGDVKGRMNPWRPSREDVDERRLAEWGEHWRLEHPEAAARTKWDSKKCVWVNPDE